MGTVMTLADGKNHTLLDAKDFQWLIQKYMGFEAERYFETLVQELQEAADFTQQKVNSDLSSYEASLESNTTAFQDIKEICLEMTNELEFGKRMNRSTLNELVQRIQKTINNQI